MHRMHMQHMHRVRVPFPLTPNPNKYPKNLPTDIIRICPLPGMSEPEPMAEQAEPLSIALVAAAVPELDEQVTGVEEGQRGGYWTAALLRKSSF